jgi:hypothetical protein
MASSYVVDESSIPASSEYDEVWGGQKPCIKAQT